MSEEYKIIDMKNWKRAMHCMVFRNGIQPQYCVSFELDITNFLKKIKEHNYSFTFAVVYAASKCANEIEEFRYRFKDENVVLYNKIDTAFTYMNNETELFKVVNVEMKDSMEDYVKLASETVKNQKEYFTGAPANNVFKFSSMPWIPYTHISHTCSGKKDNAIPLFDFGKFFERDSKIILPFSVQVHHSFVDGIHIGKFYESLQKYLNDFE